MIHRISLQDCLEPTAPPAKVLDLSALDDVVFVRIADVKQDHIAETHKDTAEISVSRQSLLEALHLLSNDADREELRPDDTPGDAKESRLSGRRLTIAPTGPSTAVGALTDHFRYTQPPARKEPATGGVIREEDAPRAGEGGCRG